MDVGLFAMPDLNPSRRSEVGPSAKAAQVKLYLESVPLNEPRRRSFVNMPNSRIALLTEHDESKSSLFELYDVRTGELLWWSARKSEERNSQHSGFRANFSPDGLKMAFYDGCVDNFILILDISTPTVSHVSRVHCPEAFRLLDNLAIHAKGPRIVLASNSINSTRFMFISDVRTMGNSLVDRCSWDYSPRLHAPALYFTMDASSVFISGLTFGGVYHIIRFNPETGERLAVVKFDKAEFTDTYYYQSHGVIAFRSQAWLVVESIRNFNFLEALLISGDGKRITALPNEEFLESEAPTRKIFLSQGRLMSCGQPSGCIMAFDGNEFSVVAKYHHKDPDTDFYSHSIYGKNAVAFTEDRLVKMNALHQFTFIDTFK